MVYLYSIILMITLNVNGHTFQLKEIFRLDKKARSNFILFIRSTSSIMAFRD